MAAASTRAAEILPGTPTRERTAPVNVSEVFSAGPKRVVRKGPLELVTEGFFVARVPTAHEGLRHHLTHGHAQELIADDEGLGELPSAYPEEFALLLARDPHTLFLLWNYPERVRREAMEGLTSPHAIVRIWEEGALVRENELALEMRSFYFHGLTPGRSYRAELLFRGGDGRTRRIGTISPRATLPPSGPSEDTTVRLMRLPWELPEAQKRTALASARVEPDAREYVPLTDFFPRDEELPWSATRPPGGPQVQPGQLPRPAAGMPPTLAPHGAPWNASGSGRGLGSSPRGPWSSSPSRPSKGN